MKTKVFRSGNSLAVRIPKELGGACGEVLIRREGKSLVIEELAEDGWPAGFFEEIKISRQGFKREPLVYQERKS
jgi:virulence-associated protein VagC